MCPKRKAEESSGERRSSRKPLGPLSTYIRKANEEREEGPSGQYKSAADGGHAAGSAKAEAVLGPDSLLPLGDPANAWLPSGIGKARIKYSEAYFKAGHMINGLFGGSGKDPKNLTILTASANTSMTLYDNRIKDALEELRRLFEYFHTIKLPLASINGSFKIELTVTASRDCWGDEIPDCYISNKITIKAKFDYDADSTQAVMDQINSLYETDSRKRNLIKQYNDHINKINNLIQSANSPVDNKRKASYLTPVKKAAAKKPSKPPAGKGKKPAKK